MGWPRAHISSLDNTLLKLLPQNLSFMKGLDLLSIRVPRSLPAFILSISSKPICGTRNTVLGVIQFLHLQGLSWENSSSAMTASQFLNQTLSSEPPIDLWHIHAYPDGDGRVEWASMTCCVICRFEESQRDAEWKQAEHFKIRCFVSHAVAVKFLSPVN